MTSFSPACDPSLRHADQSSRTQTPLRLFCQPFEDLLVSGPRKDKQKAVIARASVVPVWTWLSSTLLPEATQAFFRATKALILAGKLDDAHRPAPRQFWSLAGNAMREALASEAGVAAAKQRLAADEIVGRARNGAAAARRRRDDRRFRSCLPKPLPHLTEDILWQLRESYDALIERNPDVAPFVAVVAMNRLQRPWEALRLPLMICRQTGDALISKTDMGLVGEILFARMDALKAAIMSNPPSAVRGRDAAGAGGKFRRTLQRHGQGNRSPARWRMGSAPIEGPRRHRRCDGGLHGARGQGIRRRAADAEGKLADFSQSVRCGQAGHGPHYARLVAGTRNFAAAASFAAKQRTAFEDISNHLRRYIEDAVRELGDAMAKAARRWNPNCTIAPNSPPSCSARKKRNCSAGARARRNPPPPRPFFCPRRRAGSRRWRRMRTL